MPPGGRATLRSILTHPKFYRAVDELALYLKEECLARKRYKEFVQDFPDVVHTILGFENKGWLDSARRASVRRSNALLRLLGPEGVLMHTIYALCAEGTHGAAFELDVSVLPRATLALLRSGAHSALTPFLKGLAKHFPAHGAPKVLVLNAFEYWMVCFMYLGTHNRERVDDTGRSNFTAFGGGGGGGGGGANSMPFGVGAFNAQSFGMGVLGGAPTAGQMGQRRDRDVYGALFRQYLHFFVPLSVNYNVSVNTLRCLRRTDVHITSMWEEAAHQQLLGLATTFANVVIEFCLNSNVPTTAYLPVPPRRRVMETYVLPQLHQVRCAHLLLQHTLGEAGFATHTLPLLSTGATSASTSLGAHHVPSDSMLMGPVDVGLLSNTFFWMRRPLYLFLREALSNWTFDGKTSFEDVVSIWLDTLEPWAVRATTVAGKLANKEPVGEYNEVWLPYLVHNFPFYSHLLQLFLHMAVNEFDFETNDRDAELLCEVLDVFSQDEMLFALTSCEDSALNHTDSQFYDGVALGGEVRAQCQALEGLRYTVQPLFTAPTLRDGDEDSHMRSRGVAFELWRMLRTTERARRRSKRKPKLTAAQDMWRSMVGEDSDEDDRGASPAVLAAAANKLAFIFPFDSLSDGDSDSDGVEEDLAGPHAAAIGTRRYTAGGGGLTLRKTSAASVAYRGDALHMPITSMECRWLTRLMVAWSDAYNQGRPAREHINLRPLGNYRTHVLLALAALVLWLFLHP